MSHPVPPESRLWCIARLPPEDTLIPLVCRLRKKILCKLYEDWIHSFFFLPIIFFHFCPLWKGWKRCCLYNPFINESQVKKKVGWYSHLLLYVCMMMTACLIMMLPTVSVGRCIYATWRRQGKHDLLNNKIKMMITIITVMIMVWGDSCSFIIIMRVRVGKQGKLVLCVYIFPVVCKHGTNTL